MSGGRLNVFRAVQRVSVMPITTAQQLSDIRHHPNGNFRLAANIDLSGFPRWITIPSFYGTLDGNGFTISNLTQRNVDPWAHENRNNGFIGHNRGTIKNVTFSNVSMNVIFGGIFVANTQWELSPEQTAAR